MPVPFTSFQLFFPPHPATTWNPGELKSLPGFSRYVAQFKYDDWRTMIYFFPDGRIEFYSRKKAKLPRYRPPKSMIESLHNLELAPNAYHVLDGGLLHYKTPRVKDRIVIWDILVHANSLLLGTSFEDRFRLLEKITRHPEKWISLPYPGGGGELAIAREVARNVWLAPVFESDFSALFEKGRHLPEIEGIVLKDRTAPLERTFQMEENARWMIRARKPRIDYRF